MTFIRSFALRTATQIKTLIHKFAHFAPGYLVNALGIIPQCAL